MQNNTFTPKGSTFFIGVDAVQVKVTDNTAATSYRIVNRSSAIARIAWYVAVVSPPSFVVTAPAAGAPVVNTLSLQGNGVETYCLPPNAWFRADSATGFEVTPGEGL